MFNVFKLFFYLLRELIFDSKDEYDFKSDKFNARKFITLLLFMMLLFTNGWLLVRLITVAGERIKCIRELENLTTISETVETPAPSPTHEAVKKSKSTPSDRGGTVISLVP